MSVGGCVFECGMVCVDTCICGVCTKGISTVSCFIV